MRGDDRQQAGMWSYISPEQRRAPQTIRCARSGRWWTRSWSSCLRSSPRSIRRWDGPSIPPEKLLRALLLQVLYSTRSERLLMEQLDYNLLFRWFVGLNMDDAVWDPTVFTKNRERLLGRGTWPKPSLRARLAQARQRGLLSDEHFTVDGTLIEAWASLKSFKRQDAPPAATRRPGQPHGEFPWRAAEQRDPCLDHGSGRAAVPQGPRATRPSSPTKGTSSWRTGTGWRSRAV